MCSRTNACTRTQANAPSSYRLVGAPHILLQQEEGYPAAQDHLKLLRTHPFFQGHELQNPTVELARWILTDGTIKELKGLPNWMGKLDLSRCEWPMQPQEYRQLGGE